MDSKLDKAGQKVEAIIVSSMMSDLVACKIFLKETFAIFISPLFNNRYFRSSQKFNSNLGMVEIKL